MVAADCAKLHTQEKASVVEAEPSAATKLHPPLSVEPKWLDLPISEVGIHTLPFPSSRAAPGVPSKLFVHEVPHEDPTGWSRPGTDVGSYVHKSCQ